MATEAETAWIEKAAIEKAADALRELVGRWVLVPEHGVVGKLAAVELNEGSQCWTFKLESGDSFWVKPGAAAALPLAAAELYENLEKSLTKLVAGAAYAGKVLGLGLPVVLGLVTAALRAQLRRLEVPGSGGDLDVG